MAYYLVDYENIHEKGLMDAVALFNEGDKVIVFYSEYAKSMNLDILDALTLKKIRLYVYKVFVGTKNALDFQLASHLGYLIGKGDGKEDYYIVTNDHGFDCLSLQYKARNISVNRIGISDVMSSKIARDVKQSKFNDEPVQDNFPFIDKSNICKNPPGDELIELIPLSKTKVAPCDIATLGEVRRYIGEEDEPRIIVDILNSYKTRQAISNAINKHFKDSVRTGTIYKKLKPLLVEKHKS